MMSVCGVHGCSGWDFLGAGIADGAISWLLVFLVRGGLVIALLVVPWPRLVRPRLILLVRVEELPVHVGVGVIIPLSPSLSFSVLGSSLFSLFVVFFVVFFCVVRLDLLLGELIPQMAFAISFVVSETCLALFLDNFAFWVESAHVAIVIFDVAEEASSLPYFVEHIVWDREGIQGHPFLAWSSEGPSALASSVIIISRSSLLAPTSSSVRSAGPAARPVFGIFRRKVLALAGFAGDAFV